MDESEYNEMKEETIDQLNQMKENLASMMKGDVSLVSQVGSLQLAIQAAISQAFKTPEVVRMFATKNSGGMRQRLVDLERDKKLGKVSEGSATQQTVEILSALKKLGEKLSPEEESYLSSHMTEALASFESNANMGEGAKEGLLKTAASSVKSAQS
eukprot:TRINITY_DN273_c0_g1_i6.p1 TRINITY_DN273_c0_g1~~TRINITY_DN273_c0_g1_i6.p1  ORF type:complete len:156 (+),score=44.37 TRINITY_DN273_c0_g1_i6:232-699(+)